MRPDKFRAAILKLHSQGLCPSSIAKSVGVSNKYVYKILKEAGTKPNRSPSYLTDEDRNEMIDMLKSGKQQKEIAEYFGITQARVCEIALGLGLRRRGPYRKDAQ
jgi:transcriptional regulator